MDRVEEIEAAIDSLPPEDFRRIIEWLRERDQTIWDKQMAQDSIAGNLDFLFEEASTEAAEGTLAEWPPSH